MNHRATSVVVAVSLGCLVAACAPSDAEDAVVPGAADSSPVESVPPATAGPDDGGQIAETAPAETAATDRPAGTDPAPSGSADTGSADTAPADTAPADTDPADTGPAETDATASGAGTDGPVPRLGRVAAAVPTQGATVVHVGWALDAPWTPLAAWTGSDWMSADGGDPLPDESFGAVAIAGVGLGNPLTGYGYGGATAAVCIDDRQGPLLDAGGSNQEFTGDGSYRAVGLAADWDVQPRGLRRSGFDSADYQRIGEAIVTAAGVDPAGGDVTDVVRADLDGDGVEEVFVTFEKITDGGGVPGDFVVIYARYPTATGAVTDEVLFEYYPDEWTSRPTIGRAGVLAVADFNGDAIMEVALWSKFWDTSLAELFVYDGATSLTSVAVSGCSL